MIGNAIDKWLQHKWDVLAAAFWNTLDETALIGLVVCIFLCMFGLQAPKKWATWIVSLYIILKIFQVAHRKGIL